MCNSQVEKRSHEFEIKEDPVFLRQKAAPAASNREVWHRATAIVCASVSSFEEDEKKSHIERKELQCSSRKRDICVPDAVCYLVIPPFKLWQKEEAPLLLRFQQNLHSSGKWQHTHTHNDIFIICSS